MIVRIAAAVLFALTFAAHAGAAELKVLGSGAVKDAYLDLIPQFEKVTGHKVTVTWAGTVDIKKRIAAGEVYDVVMIAAPELDAFAKEGKVKPGSKVDLVRSSVGVAVKAGAPKPDVSSGEKLKQALLAAKSVSFSTGPSGVYILKLFDKMGIADAMQAKSKQTKPGARVAKVVADGEAEIGFQQVSELVNEPGIAFLGPLSPDVDNVTVFSSAIHTGASQPDAAKALQTFLTDKARAPVLKEHGLDPA